MSESEFDSIMAVVDEVVDPSARLPEVPFRRRGGRVTVGEFTLLLGLDYLPVIRTLADACGDDEVVVATIAPALSEFRGTTDFFPGFIVPIAELQVAYLDGLRYSPTFDPTVDMQEMSDVLAVAGRSGRWALWGERSWELALVWTDADVDIASSDPPLVGAREAVVSFAGYGSWGTLLDPGEVEQFIRTVDSWA